MEKYSDVSAFLRAPGSRTVSGDGIDLLTERATPDVLRAYGAVSIAFRATSRLRVRPDPDRPGRFSSTEEAIAEPFRKDYDALGDRPSRWPDQFDLSHWAVIGAWAAERRIGGAVIAFDTDGVDMLEGRRDLALLWDLRVHPDDRRRGVGTRLFDACVAWSRAEGCKELKVETQDINVAACRFYAARGCVLAEARPGAYAACPDETMLIWRLALS